MAQLIARCGWGVMVWALCACSAPTPSPASAPPHVETPGSVPAAASGADHNYPVREWSYAESLEELHGVWVERFTLQTLPEVDGQRLWPYADAVLLNGDSWGIEPALTQLYYGNADGEVRRMAGAQHPTAKGPKGELVSGEALTASGWAEVMAGTSLFRSASGTGFRVAAPITAVSSCISCHGWIVGRPVAMLVYDFQEIADD